MVFAGNGGWLTVFCEFICMKLLYSIIIKWQTCPLVTVPCFPKKRNPHCFLLKFPRTCYSCLYFFLKSRKLSAEEWMMVGTSVRPWPRSPWIIRSAARSGSTGSISPPLSRHFFRCCLEKYSNKLYRLFVTIFFCKQELDSLEKSRKTPNRQPQLNELRSDFAQIWTFCVTIKAWL